MKESKYYTPETSEFHVGFEYEKFGYWGGSEKIWKPVKVLYEDLIWDSDGNVNCFNTELEDIRVKYLDKEDIEELRFKHENTYKGLNTNIFYKNNIKLIHGASKNHLFLSICCDKTGPMFKGNIKNKSELKRLMTQLGI